MRAFCLVAIVAVLTGCGSADKPIPVPYRNLLDQPHSWSGYGTPTALVVKTAPEWTAAWETLWAGMSPTPPIAAVDFTTEIVLVFGMGGQPSSGYWIAVESLDLLGGALRAHLVETSPGPTCVTATVITEPATAVAVPIHDEPLEEHRRTEVHVCPP